MLNELRVLNGLHHGALLPLAGEQCLIGSSSDADLVLPDTAIKPHHCRLLRHGSGWQIEPLQGEIMTEEGHCLRQDDDIVVGVPFSLDGIWLCVAKANSAWPEKKTTSTVPAQGAVSSQLEEHSGRRSKPLAGLLSLVLASAAVASGFFWNQHEERAQPLPYSPQPGRLALTAPSEVVEILASMFMEAGLSSFFSLRATDDGRVMISQTRKTGRLAEARKLLERFQEIYQSSVSLTLSVADDLSSLPFHVAQIVKGEQPYLLTDDGQRVFINDEIAGIQLLAITDHKLIFQGEQQFEVLW